MKQNLGRKRKHFLKISNVDYLLEYYQEYEYYKNPYVIMAELEKTIEFSQGVKDVILIDYKNEGSYIFELVRTDGKVLTYECTGSVS